jgi:hypothetical protein
MSQATNNLKLSRLTKVVAALHNLAAIYTVAARDAQCPAIFGIALQKPHWMTKR